METTETTMMGVDPESGTTAPHNTIGLQRVLSRWDGISLLTGIIIGSGIFASPGVVLQYLHGSAFLTLLIWLLAAFIAMNSSLIYGELGTMFPAAAGGDYDYIKNAFGDAAAFAWSFCMFWVIKAGSIAIISVTFAAYFRRAIYPSEESLSQDGDWIEKTIALFIIVIITSVNCLTVKFASKCMNALASLKVVLVLMIVGLMIAQLSTSTKILVDNFHNSAEWEGLRSLDSLGPALVAALWAFDGWNDITFMSEELKSPERDIGPIIIASTTIVTITYLLCNIAYFSTLPYKRIMSTSVVAIDVAGHVGGRFAAILISLLVALSTMGTLTGSIMTGGRFMYATARDGQFPRPLMKVSERFKTPFISLIVQGIWALILVGFPGSELEELLNYFGFASWLFYGVTAASSIVLRCTAPYNEYERPFKIPLYPVPPVILILISFYMILNSLWEKPLTSLAAFSFVIAAFPIHHFMKKLSKDKDNEKNLSDTNLRADGRGTHEDTDELKHLLETD